MLEGRGRGVVELGDGGEVVLGVPEVGAPEVVVDGADVDEVGAPDVDVDVVDVVEVVEAGSADAVPLEPATTARLPTPAGVVTLGCGSSRRGGSAVLSVGELRRNHAAGARTTASATSASSTFGIDPWLVRACLPARRSPIRVSVLAVDPAEVPPKITRAQRRLGPNGPSTVPTQEQTTRRAKR